MFYWSLFVPTSGCNFCLQLRPLVKSSNIKHVDDLSVDREVAEEVMMYFGWKQRPTSNCDVGLAIKNVLTNRVGQRVESRWGKILWINLDGRDRRASLSSRPAVSQNTSSIRGGSAWNLGGWRLTIAHCPLEHRRLIDPYVTVRRANLLMFYYCCCFFSISNFCGTLIVWRGLAGN